MPNQQRKIGDGPVMVKALRLGDGRDHHESLGCVAMLYQPSSREGPPPQRHRYTKDDLRIAPPPEPSRPSGVTIVGPTIAIATHTSSQNHCAQDGRDTIDTSFAPGPNIATEWACPTPVDTSTERRCTNNTQSQGHRAVCPSATHMSTKQQSDEARQECSHSNANTLGPDHHMARTHQADDKSK